MHACRIEQSLSETDENGIGHATRPGRCCKFATSTGIAVAPAPTPAIQFRSRRTSIRHARPPAVHHRLHRRLLLARRGDHCLAQTHPACRQFDRGDGTDHRLLPSGAGAGLPLRQPCRRELPRGRGAQLRDLGDAAGRRPHRNHGQRDLRRHPGGIRLFDLHRRHPLSAGLVAGADRAHPDQPDARPTQRRGRRAGVVLVYPGLLSGLGHAVSARHAGLRRLGRRLARHPDAGRRRHAGAKANAGRGRACWSA
jgi:hypothetical protein